MDKKIFIFAAFAVIALLSCNKSDKANKTAGEEGNMMINSGSTVSMDYTLTVDGKVVDTSSGREPLIFVQGTGQIIPGLDGELIGLKKGDKKNVSVAPEVGYGTVDPNAIKKLPKAAFNEAEQMKAGDVVTGNVEGQEFQAKIVEVGGAEVTLDLNHPLAGKTLNFDVEIKDVR